MRKQRTSRCASVPVASTDYVTGTAHIPAGISHAAYVLAEAEAAFKLGNTKDGVINLAHAVYVVANEGGIDAAEARAWFGRVTAAAEAFQ